MSCQRRRGCLHGIGLDKIETGGNLREKVPDAMRSCTVYLVLRVFATQELLGAFKARAPLDSVLLWGDAGAEAAQGFEGRQNCPVVANLL